MFVRMIAFASPVGREHVFDVDWVVLSVTKIIGRLALLRWVVPGFRQILFKRRASIE